MSVRRAAPGDAAALARLLTAFNQEFDAWVPHREVLERRFERLLGCDAVIALLAEDPAPVGLALATLRPSPYYDGPVASLDELYVEPGHRGRGFGSQLLALLDRCVRDRRCGEIQINVDEEDTGARRFYERHGFTNVEPGTAERMLCYLKEL